MCSPVWVKYETERIAFNIQLNYPCCILCFYASYLLMSVCRSLIFSWVLILSSPTKLKLSDDQGPCLCPLCVLSSTQLSAGHVEFQ